MEGGIFPGMEFVRGGCPGESLPVSSELLNMLLHVTLGCWLKGGFIRWVSPGRAGLFIP